MRPTRRKPQTTVDGVPPESGRVAAGGLPAPCATLRGGAEGGRVRHLQGKGLPGRHEAVGVQGAGCFPRRVEDSQVWRWELGGANCRGLASDESRRRVEEEDYVLAQPFLRAPFSPVHFRPFVSRVSSPRCVPWLC